MKIFRTKVISMVILGFLVALPLLGIANAESAYNLKVNGKIDGTVFVVGTPVSFQDTLQVQTLSDLDSNTGSGSLHGINCGATMFFVYTVTPIGEFWKLTGTIVATNMGHQRYYGWLLDLRIILTITSADSMTLTITDESDNVYFSGSGTPITNNL